MKLCAVLLSMFVVAACSTLGLTTFNDQLSAGYDLATTLLQTDLSLGESGVLTRADAKNIENQIDLGKQALDIARQVHATDPTGGSNKLAMALTALEAVDTYLKTKSTVKP